MPNVLPSQLQSVLGQLDQALYNHEQWHRNISRALISRLPADPPDLHRHCRFGQWYDSAETGP